MTAYPNRIDVSALEPCVSQCPKREACALVGGCIGRFVREQQAEDQVLDVLVGDDPVMREVMKVLIRSRK